MKAVTVLNPSGYLHTSSVWPKFRKATKEDFFRFNQKENKRETIS